MGNFIDFVARKSHELTASALVRSLLEANIDPVRYVYFRLVEAGTPPQAAAAAGAPAMSQAPQVAPQAPVQPQNDPNNSIKQLSTIVNQMVQAHAKTHPEMGKMLVNMQKEVQGLQMAAQKDSQQPQQNAVQQPGQPAAKPAVPQQGQPAKPGVPAVPQQGQPAKPGVPAVPQQGQPAKPGVPAVPAAPAR